MPHPDEGLIHAWLDGQLPPDEAARVEALVASDAEWSAAAAEARGLIAASSRIVSALDHVPANVVPKGKGAPAIRRVPNWMKIAAAIVVVAGGSTVMLQRAPEAVTLAAPAAEKVPASTVTARPSIAPPAAQPAPTTAPTRPMAVTPAPKSGPMGGATTAGSAVASSGLAREAAEPVPAAKATGEVSVRDARADAAAEARVVASPPPALLQQRTAAESLQRSFAARASRTEMKLSDVVVTGVAPAAPEKRMAEAPIAASPRRDATLNSVVPFAAARRMVAPGACYRLTDNRTGADLNALMQVQRVDGDTLRLAAVPATSPLRAWVVVRDSVARGVLTSEPAGRGLVLVTALPVACPKP